MGKGSPPSPPDPRETAGAQTASNIGTAIANQQLLNTNQITPYGNLSFQQTGTYQYKDPLNDEVYDLPQYTAITQLTPEQQQVLAGNNQTSINLAALGANQSARLDSLLSRPLDTSTLPAPGDPSGVRRANLVTGAPQPEFFAPTQSATLQSAGQASPLQMLAGQGPNLTTAPNAPTFQAPGQAPALQRAGAGPQYQTGYDIAQQQSVGGGPQLLDSLGANPDLIDSYGGAPSLIDALGDAGPITRTYGTDWSEDRRRVEQTLFDRMNPQLERDRKRLEQRLSDQGIQIGSEAYKNAMDDYSRSVNDARMATILSGGQEQSRLADLEARRAGFQNAAQQQAFGQGVTGATFTNDARMQGADQAARAAAFTNQARQQGADNAARSASFTNQARLQGSADQLARAGFNNQASQQNTQNAAAAAAFANQANAAQASDALARTGFNNQAAQQEAASNLERLAMGNSLAQLSGQNAMAQAAFNNQAALQGEDAAIRRTGFNNQVSQAQDADALSRLQYNNTVAQQAANDDLTRTQYANQLLQMGGDNAMRAAQFANQSAIGQQNADASMVQMQDAARQQALQQNFALRNQPLNELTAIMSGTQVQNPTLVNTQTAQMPNVDYAGLVNQNYAQELAAYNQQQAQRGQLIGGLLGLGGSLGGAWIGG